MVAILASAGQVHGWDLEWPQLSWSEPMRLVSALCLAGLLASPAFPQSATAPAPHAVATAAITRAMDDSAAAWNLGDLRTFMDCYENSPETTFVGKTVTHGWQQVMDRYLKNYNTPEKMGHLDYSELQIRVLDSQTAAVTGRYKLTRTAAGGGDASGVFSLVFFHTAKGWKIVLDHSVSD
jgi:ketosteroid isomerase-like protein